MTDPRPGELWAATLPGVEGELLVVVVDGEREQTHACAVLECTMGLSRMYRVGTLHAWPLGSNDRWRRVA